MKKQEINDTFVQLDYNERSGRLEASFHLPIRTPTNETKGNRSTTMANSDRHPVGSSNHEAAARA